MQNQRALSSFPLPPTHRMKLQAAGFVTVEDLEDVKPSELSKELNVSHQEALEILQLVRDANSSQAGDDTVTQTTTPTSSTTDAPASSACARTLTALEMLEDEHAHTSIVTFSEALDGALGGGVPVGKITEFCGAPGVGKTQVCMQLSVDVQLPEVFGGTDGTAVYIDTEGSLIVDRARDIAAATVTHCRHIAELEQNSEQLAALQSFTLESILRNIHYFRCHDHIELLAVIQLMPDFLKEHPRVRLIVVDSIAFHFRHNFDDFALRTRILNGIAQSLIKMATMNKLAVVLTNQMTTRFSSGSADSSHLVPALGESWGHAATIRVILHWRNHQRHAMLYKSPSQSESVVPYQITMGGVRDLPPEDVASSPPDVPVSPPAKRPRIESS